MTSLNRFRQRLSGEKPQKKENPQLDNWLNLVTEKNETEVAVEEVETEILSKVESMTKAEIDLYASEHHGITLDRRQSKIKLIEEFIQKLKEKN